MITGDQSTTAYVVAEQLNLNKGERPIILDSTELIALDTEIMEALAKNVNVYSRVSPAHKLKIVQALQSIGKVVAMTGDGINDGPALKSSDIGIAMGKTGTDVAREVADIVLEDDNLETLIIAIRDGRTTYGNIRKSIHFFLATNLSEIMLMFTAMAAGIGFPLNVMQLLWINIISDIFPGLTLSLEDAETDVLDQPPRDPHSPLLSKGDYKRMAFESSAITAGALGAYGYGIARYGLGAKAGTMAFQGLTLGQLLHAVSCRSERHSVFGKTKIPPNRYFNIAVWGSVLLQAFTMFIPGLRNILGITSLDLLDTAVVGCSALLPLAVNESTKVLPEEEDERRLHVHE
jgi:Ca2+-transporting ATPase